MLAEFAHAVEIVAQYVPIASGQAIVAHHSAERLDYIVQFAFVVIMPGKLVLQLVQLLQRASEAKLVRAKWKCRRPHVFHILADVLEESLAPILAMEKSVAIAVSIPIAVPISVGIPIAVPIAVPIPIGVPVAIPIPVEVAAWRRSTLIRSVPRDFEAIYGSTVLRILDSNYGRAAIARIANQLLPAAAGERAKMKIRRTGRQGSCALKPPPLWRRASEIPHHGFVPAHFDFGDSVDPNFNRASAFARRPARAHGCVAFIFLSG